MLPKQSKNTKPSSITDKENANFLVLFGAILWFDPRREHSSIPTAESRSRRAQGLSRLAASSRPPEGLGLDWPEHGGILDRIGAGGACHIIGKFKPVALGEIHAAGDNREKAPQGLSAGQHNLRGFT